MRAGLKEDNNHQLDSSFHYLRSAFVITFVQSARIVGKYSILDLVCYENQVEVLCCAVHLQ